MKHKAFAGIMALLLITVAFSVFPVPTSAQEGVIHVGVIGPNGWPQFDGMQQGAEIARDWINDMSPGGGGGITVGGTTYTVQLHVGYENPCDFCLPPTTGSDEMRRLITVENCKFIFGGFMSEYVFPIREVAMDYKTPFFICGASANELVDCGDGTCGACVRCDYDRYRYLFRVNPVNITTTVKNILGFLRDVPGESMIPLMAKMYGNPVRTAVIAENLTWNLGMFTSFITGALGPNATVVYYARTPYGETYFVPYLDAMHAAQVRLMVIIYSAPDSITLMQQYAVHPIKAVPLGIDVLGQFQWPWEPTAGGCEFETLLATTGYRTPICPEVTGPTTGPYTTQEFWDRYVATYGRWPIYTSWGVYDGIIALKELLEAIDAAGDADCVKPYLDCDTSDGACLIPFIEQTDLNGITGKLKYTGPHPMDSSEYATYTCGDCGKTYLEINPTMNGTLHDRFSNEFLHEWCDGYTRPLVAQWQAGKLEVVFPKFKCVPTLLSFWKRFLFPPRMYADVSIIHRCDLDYNGRVEMRDISLAARSFGSYPCHPRYDRGAALIVDDYPPGYYDEPVSMRDIAAIARCFGAICVPYPVPYDP